VTADEEIFDDGSDISLSCEEIAICVAGVVTVGEETGDDEWEISLSYEEI